MRELRANSHELSLLYLEPERCLTFEVVVAVAIASALAAALASGCLLLQLQNGDQSYFSFIGAAVYCANLQFQAAAALLAGETILCQPPPPSRSRQEILQLNPKRATHKWPSHRLKLEPPPKVALKRQHYEPKHKHQQPNKAPSSHKNLHMRRYRQTSKTASLSSRPGSSFREAN